MAIVATTNTEIILLIVFSLFSLALTGRAPVRRWMLRG